MNATLGEMRRAMMYLMASAIVGFPCVTALRGQSHVQAALTVNQSTPNLGLGIAAVSKYAGGNCQFMPAFDVAAFLVEEAPAAAKGVGMLAKPAVTAVQVAAKVAGEVVPGAGAAANVVSKGVQAAGVAGAVSKGTKTLTLASKAGLLGKVVGGALSLSNPLGMVWTAFNVGTTAYQLYELQKIMRDPHQLCEVLSDWVPPYDQAACLKGLRKNLPGLQLPPNIPGLQPPPGQLAVAKIDKKVALAAAAVLMASTGALALWHHSLHSVAYDRAICPRNLWLEDPTLVDWYPDDASSSSGSSASMEEEEEDMLGFSSAPMPRCYGLRWVSVPTQCSASDLSCQQRTCQQACCDDKKCSLYQFDTNSVGKCWLGESSQFTAEKCEQWVGKVKDQGGFQEDPKLFVQVMGLKKVPNSALEAAKPKSCGMRPLSADACAALTCEDLCQEQTDCRFYQLRIGRGECWLGTAELPNQAPELSWHGGLLDSSQSQTDCEGGFLCPSDQKCVETCAECSGFTLGAENEKRCRRTAEEGICDPSSWEKDFEATSLDATQCQGLSRVVVKMSEATGFNGHAICQEACCSDPSCVLYQLRSKAAQETHRKAGDTVHCWLGFVDSSQNPLFKCGGRGWRGDRRSWEGGFLSSRGCSPSQGASCLLSGECVQSCSSQCPGADIFDQSHNSCVASAVKEAMPVIPLVDGGGISTYYISTTDEASADTLLMVTQNKHRLIETPSQEACQTLSFGATECSAVTEDGETKCSCIYPDMQSCTTWFESHFHLRPVISEVGMLLLAGEGCDCFDEAESFDQHFRCHFENLQEVPSIKASKEATMALKIP